MVDWSAYSRIYLQKTSTMIPILWWKSSSGKFEHISPNLSQSAFLKFHLRGGLEFKSFGEKEHCIVPVVGSDRCLPHHYGKILGERLPKWRSRKAYVWLTRSCEVRCNELDHQCCEVRYHLGLGLGRVFYL